MDGEGSLDSHCVLCDNCSMHCCLTLHLWEQMGKFRHQEKMNNLAKAFLLFFFPFFNHWKIIKIQFSALIQQWKRAGWGREAHRPFEPAKGHQWTPPKGFPKFGSRLDLAAGNQNPQREFFPSGYHCEDKWINWGFRTDPGSTGSSTSPSSSCIHQHNPCCSNAYISSPLNCE